MELTIEQALKKAVEAHKAGQVHEADRLYTAILKTQPKHPDANHNLGVLAVGMDRVEEALTFFRIALEANSSVPQFWLSYIDILIKLNRIDDAKAVFDQAKTKCAQGDAFDKIERLLAGREKDQEPTKNQLDYLFNLYTQDQHQEAINLASQLLVQFPNSINLHNIIGVANQSLGKLDEAIAAYNKALSIKPDLAEIFNNIGNALKDQSKMSEAIESYKRALNIKPNYAEAYSNMGATLYDQGKRDEAIEAYQKALSIKPDFVDAYNNFGAAIKGVVFTKPNRDFNNTIGSLLDRQTNIRPKDIAKAAISLLKLEPTLQKYQQLTDNHSIQNHIEAISDLSNLPLLLKLMSLCPLPDIEIEKLLTNLRCNLLSNISSLKEASPELMSVQSALALQCFTNEYIYNKTWEEEKIIHSLEVSVTRGLDNNEQPSPHTILALASYKALNDYDWYKFLVVTDHIKEVFARQVEEPNKEEKLKQELPLLEEISDSISLKVRQQYEERPYPRWVKLGLPLKPMPISNVVDQIKLKLDDKRIKEVEKPEILIAGCGTGQHSIGTAARFKSSMVLAIDLSISSLAYAKRKTKDLGIENISYMQADILGLAKLNKKFHIIECAGVLHHLDDPMAGWKELTDCLKPGGLMKIGLYSELARQHIVKIRKEISSAGIGSNDEEMKFFRNTIMKSKKDHHKRIINSSDFYSLSELKDLLFHVQEHRFTIPQIKCHLNKLGLTFCGFESPQIVSNFQQANRNQEDPYDLDKWQIYEEANPRSFADMYQFWCQKLA